MPPLPRVTASQVIRAMQKMGFTLSRLSGSHGIYHNKEGRRITVPQHPGKTLHPKLLKAILEDAGSSVEQFIEPL